MRGKEKEMTKGTYTENVIVRMSPRDKRELMRCAKARGISMSELIRDSVIHPPQITRSEYNELRRLILYDIRKIGNNINQIAKKYNEYAYVEPSLELMSQMNKIIELMYQVDSRIRDQV